MVQSCTAKDDDNVAKSVLTTQIEGSRARGRLKRRWVARLKQDMKQNNIRPERTVRAVAELFKTSTLPMKRQKGQEGEIIYWLARYIAHGSINVLEITFRSCEFMLAQS